MLSYNPRIKKTSTYVDLVEKWNQGKFDTDALILNNENPHGDDATTKGKDPPEYPRRVRSSGLSNGISVVLDPDMDQYFCTAADSTGFQVRHLYHVTPNHAEVIN